MSRFKQQVAALVGAINDHWARSYADLFDAAGIDKTKRPFLRNCLNPNLIGTDNLNLINLTKMLDVSPTEVRRSAFADYLFDWGLAVFQLPNPAESGATSLYGADARATREKGDVSRVLIEALADGKISSAEKDRLRTEVMEAISELLALMAQVEEA